MQRLFSLLIPVVLFLGLAACSKSEDGAGSNAGGAPGSASPQPLTWDAGNWNQTNWQ